MAIIMAKKSYRPFVYMINHINIMIYDMEVYMINHITHNDI